MYYLLQQWSEQCHAYVDSHIDALNTKLVAQQKVLLNHDERIIIVEEILKDVLQSHVSKPASDLMV